MNLNVKIDNIKCINHLEFSFPLESGIYAITGENGSGKSTLISCAATVFYQLPMIDYFGKPTDAKIEFALEEATRIWACDGRSWSKNSSEAKMYLNGFYEGSIIFGNRFRDTKLSAIRIMDGLSENDMLPADEFVRKNLGIILHDDVQYFKKMFSIKKK